MLNEDDKKYLKGNIEKKIDDLDKKMSKKSSSAKSVNNPTTEIGKKLQELYKKDEEREDTKKYLEELKNKNDNGEATIAQKIEMLSLNLKTAIPDDFKIAMKETSASMKKGANQAISGANHLVGRAMMTNPLTALLWQNRDIAKAMWDMGMGGAKILGSAIGGIGRGAAGLVNASVNMFKKKDKPKTEEEVPEQEETPRSVIDSDNDLEDLSEEEKSTAQKINELHDLFFKGKFFQKQEKEEKQRQNILSKGLSGLGKSMQAVNKVIEVIAAKQKLILGGLMLGAVGILALVGWFKDGGFERLIDRLNPKNEHNKKNENRNSLVRQNVTTAPYSGKELQSMFNEQSKNMTNLTGGNISYSKIPQGNYNRHTGRTSYIKDVKATFNNGEKGKLAPVLAPFDGECTSLKLLTKINNGESTDRRFEISIKPRKKDIIKYTQGKKSDSITSWELQELIIENLIEPQVDKGDTFSKGFPLGFSDGSVTFRAASGAQSGEAEKAILENYLKDYNTQIDEAKKDNYAGNFEILAKEKTKDRADKLVNSVIKATRDSNAVLSKDNFDPVYNTIDWLEYSTNFNKERDKVNSQIVGDINNVNNTRFNKNEVDDLSGNPEITKTQLPPDNTNAGNKTDTDIENKKQELKEVEKQIAENQKAVNTVPSSNKQSPVNVSVSPQEQNIPSQSSEMMNVSQYNRATESN